MLPTVKVDRRLLSGQWLHPRAMYCIAVGSSPAATLLPHAFAPKLPREGADRWGIWRPNRMVSHEARSSRSVGRIPAIERHSQRNHWSLENRCAGKIQAAQHDSSLTGRQLHMLLMLQRYGTAGMQPDSRTRWSSVRLYESSSSATLTQLFSGIKIRCLETTCVCKKLKTVQVELARLARQLRVEIGACASPNHTSCRLPAV